MMHHMSVENKRVLRERAASAARCNERGRSRDLTGAAGAWMPAQSHPQTSAGLIFSVLRPGGPDPFPGG
eukprot:9098810-Pyramimonas_sp.AAC.1